MAAALKALDAASAVVGIGSAVMDLLPTHRQCSITISNHSSYRLINPGMYISSGQCAKELPHEIGPNKEAIVEFKKTPHTARGAVGVFTYDLYKGGYYKKLAFMFSVPYDYNLYSNWHAAGIFGMHKACDYNLYYEMYNSGENGFTRRKGGSRITHTGGGLTVRTTMADTYTPVMTVEILGK